MGSIQEFHSHETYPLVPLHFGPSPVTGRGGGGLEEENSQSEQELQGAAPNLHLLLAVWEDDWAWGSTQGRELGRSWLDRKFGVCPSQTGPETLFHFKVPTLSLCQHNSRSQ